MFHREEPMSTDICQINFVDGERVSRAREALPAPSLLGSLADTHRVLGDPTRLRILFALAATELCVCDLSALLEATPSAVSHQLRLLRAAGLVRYRREGKLVYYTLDDDHIRTLLLEGLRHLQAGEASLPKEHRNSHD